MGGLNATKKPQNPARRMPQARGDAQGPIGCPRAPGEQATKGRPPSPGEGAPPGTRDGTTLSSAVRPSPPQGPDSQGANTPQPGSRGSAWLPARAPEPAGSGDHSARAAAPAVAAESETSCGRRRRPSTSSVSPQRLGRPTTLSSGGQGLSSAPQAPWEQDGRAEPRAVRGAEGRLGAGAVGTPKSFRGRRREADPFSQTRVILILIESK